MEKNPEVVDDHTQNSVDDTSAEKTDQSAKGDTVAYETYDRVLRRHKKLEAKLQELEGLQEVVKSYEQKELEAKGEQNKLIDSLRKELADKDRQLKESTRNYAWTNLTSQLQTVAAKEGCVDPTALIRLMDDEDLGTVEVDDHYRVNGEDATRLIGKMRDKYKYLFGKQAPSIADTTPSDAASKPKKKTLKDMSRQELSRMLAKQMNPN